MSELDRVLDAAPQQGPVRVEGEGWTAEVDTRQVGPVGVVVDRLRVEGQPGDVAERARAIADRLRPQGERLDAVEVDPRLGGAVLRTRPEDIRGGRYFQVDIDTRGAEISRHQRRPGGRAPQPFAVTREELGRVIEGLGEVLAGSEPEE